MSYESQSQPVSDALRATTSSSEPSALADLLRRVEEASGPNFALECEICRLVDPAHRRGFVPPAYTDSLDAALALVERCLPGWFVGIQQNRGMSPAQAWSAYLDHPSDHETSQDVVASTPALALIGAMLRALPTPSAGDE